MTGLALLAVVATLAGGSGRQMTVACNVRADPGVEGYAYLETGAIHLRPEWCAALRGHRTDGYAALVLGHEVGHVALQTRDEQRAECYGLAHVRLIARLLGWDPRVAFAQARYRTFCGVG